MSLLLIDLDNTVYNWIDFFGKSFRGMVHALSKKMDRDENELKLAFKKIYNEAGSLDYIFVIQALPFFDNYPQEQRIKLIEFGKKIFQMVRNRNLVLYDGVKETLKQLNSEGVIIVAVTNAPILLAEQRLRLLHIDNYVCGLAGYNHYFKPPGDDYSEKIIQKQKTGKYESKHINRRWFLSINELKPNPFGYLTVINDLRISHKNTYVIGDSISKDLNPGHEIGATTIWARYGTKYDNKNFETLLEMTHWDDNKVKETYDEQHITTPNFTIDTFESLLDIVKRPSQLKLF